MQETGIGESKRKREIEKETGVEERYRGSHREKDKKRDRTGRERKRDRSGRERDRERKRTTEKERHGGREEDRKRERQPQRGRRRGRGERNINRET